MRSRPTIGWLFGFIPITLILEHVGASPPTVFFAAALAIVPIASLIARSTEQLAHRTGDAVGGLLNATFGNAAELIIAMVALSRGLHDVVKASLTGSIIGNVLLVLGAALLTGGLKRERQTFDRAAAAVRPPTPPRRHSSPRVSRRKPMSICPARVFPVSTTTNASSRTSACAPFT